MHTDNPYRDPEPTLQTQLATYDGKAYGHHGIDYYKLKKVNVQATGSLDYKLTTKAVVTGHLTPNDNLSNVTDGQPIEKFRTMVEIDPAFYKYLAVQVLCTADFETEPVDLVRGRLRYQQVGINEVTVKAHRGQVMRKMQADSLAELVTMAMRLGVLPAATH